MYFQSLFSTLCSTFGDHIPDSAAGTTFCVGVIGMQHAGVGGGGFALVRSTDGRYESIDFRETAPAAAYEDMYENNTIGSIRTGLASGIPGEVRGLHYLHSNYGVLPWDVVLQGAIDVARYGFPVTEDLVRYMGYVTHGEDSFLVSDPTWAIDFAPNGTLLGLDETITRKRLANTLETIAQYGPDAFYTGAMAEAMIRTLRTANGTMTMEDLKDYQIVSGKVAELDYRGFKLRSCSAPSGGSVLLAALNIVEGYADMGEPDHRNLSTHRLDEAIRFAYGQRTSLGDPAFVSGIDGYETEMLNVITAAEIRSKISDYHTLNVSAYDPAGIESRETPGTSAVMSADSSGLAITLTTTVNLLFGSQIMVPETGVIMNNEMNDFSIPGASNAFGYVPSPSNYIRPGKRPLSSITPVIVEHSNGSLYFVVGAAGGSRIITSTLQSIWNVLDHNMTAPQALAEPRLHDQLIPNQVSFEYAYNNETVDFMIGRGHNVTWVAPG